MENSAKSAGIALLLGSLFIILTLVLHPVGGSLEHLQSIRRIAIISHAIAILSIPLNILGYWGLSQIVGLRNALSASAVIIMGLAQIAVLLAAALNGLVIPLFLERVEIMDASRPGISMILQYNFAINQAMDLVYITGMALALLLWSSVIISQKRLPTWLGYSALIIGLIFLVSILMGFNLSDLNALRVFMSAILLWTITVGAYLWLKAHDLATT